MPRDPANAWYKPVMRELKAGRMTAADAARLAGISRERVRQWCAAAGFDPAERWQHRLAVFYARELLRMAKRDRVRLPDAMMSKARKPRRARASKTEQRALIDAKVIDFIAAGGKIKRK